MSAPISERLRAVSYDQCQQDPAAIMQMCAEADRTIDELVEVLEYAAGWFEGYAHGHAAKGTTEGDAKADTNRTRAAFLRKAADKVKGGAT